MAKVSGSPEKKWQELTLVIDRDTRRHIDRIAKRMADDNVIDHNTGEAPTSHALAVNALKRGLFELESDLDGGFATTGAGPGHYHDENA